MYQYKQERLIKVEKLNLSRTEGYRLIKQTYRIKPINMLGLHVNGYMVEETKSLSQTLST